MGFGFRLRATLLAVCLISLPGLSAQESGPSLSARQLQDNLAAKTYSGRRIDLVFTKTGLRDVIAALEKTSGISFDLDPAVNDLVTYRMLDIPWDEALAAVLADNDLHLLLKPDESGFKVARGRMVVLAMPDSGRTKFVLFLYKNLTFLAAGIAALAAFAAGFWLFGRRRGLRRKAGRKPLLTPEAVEQVKARLIRAMQDERLYRDEDLTLQTLSEKMAVSPHQLSWVINQEMNRSFSSLVNGYRIDEVKSRLAGSASNGDSILQMAMEAGFNSKAAFNRAFKAHTGMTPSDYKNSLSRPS